MCCVVCVLCCGAAACVGGCGSNRPPVWCQPVPCLVPTYAQCGDRRLAVATDEGAAEWHTTDLGFVTQLAGGCAVYRTLPCCVWCWKVARGWRRWHAAVCLRASPLQPLACVQSRPTRPACSSQCGIVCWWCVVEGVRPPAAFDGMHEADLARFVPQQCLAPAILSPLLCTITCRTL